MNVNGQYDFPLYNWRGFVSGSYRWQSEVIFNLLQDPDSVQEEYGIAGIAIGAQNERFKLTLFGNNIFDKSYALTRGRSSIFNTSATTNPPTNYVTWTPARDSERYLGVRLAAYF
jgi:iron complex outermembrane receptor protein